jgi:transposase
MIHYRVQLLPTEVVELSAIISKGSHSTRTLRNAYILLNCDEGRHTSKVTDEQLARVLCISDRTIERVKKRFCEEGWEALFQRKPARRIYEGKMDGEVEAHLIQLCCSEPPEGRTRWTLRLLADKMAELKYVRNLSHVTVREVLKKMNLSPGKRKVESSRRSKIALL